MNAVQLQDFIKKELFLKNGKYNGQALNNCWMEDRGFKEQKEQLHSLNIYTTQDVYNFLYNETPICECGQYEKRFISFKDGYKEYCEKCGRTKNNGSKSYECSHIIVPDTLFLKRKQLKEDIKLLKNNGKFLAARTRYPKINNYKENLYENILDSTFYLPEDCQFNERLFHIENDLKETQKCVSCGGPLDTFFSNIKGYRSHYCKVNGCAINISNKNKIGKAKNLAYFYEKYITKYTHQNSDEYQVEFFSFDDYVKYRDNAVIKYTHTKCNKKYERILGYQGKYECPFCYPTRSKQQFLIYDYIVKKHNVEGVFNDRRLLNGKEIDILIGNLGIEYDGQAFHSFGTSTYTRFDNACVESIEKYKDLEKLEECEEKGINLFRIFSSEWLGDKSYIWQSMIDNKLRKNKKIFARKCIIKEITSPISSKFIEENHIQGNINASIRLGLFYENELVQVMTFGKPRVNKWKEKGYLELYRLCSRLNTSVIGGASKLLKYLERNFNPVGIISYANRRWSQGNVYEKLGFEWLYNSEPNYFYIKGNDYEANKLEPRNKFQKHKLKKELENFNPNLTETENMYNNNYRKIYDCGNKVYIKAYK